MQNDLQDSALLEAILDAAVDGIIVSDAAGTILRANAQACRLFDYETTEMVGQSVNLLMPQAFADLHDGFIRRHIQTGDKQVIGIGRDLEGQRKDGTVFPLHISIGAMQLADQRMFVGILHDLTRRVATQEALARSQRLDAIGQMTGGIAHDFNNLLTVVIGNLELLSMRGADDRQAPLIHDAIEAAELGSALTRRLMQFARKGNLKPVEANLKDLCEETLALLSRTLGSSFQMRTEYTEPLDRVMIDPAQLQSALVNLALNARDAMGKKGEILISVANVEIDDTYMAQETDIEPGNYVRLSVSDNGAGMSSEAQKRAFEPFYTTKAESGGSGLGLAMIYGFVRQSGGHITIYSELGMGTSFGLYFPTLPRSEDAATPSPALTQERSDPRGKGEVVLVVEDNPKILKLSVARLHALGFETEQASSGDEAYRMLQEGRKIDIVFSDLVMPGKLNGYDLATTIADKFPDIKILLTSGYASDLVTGTVAHAVDYDILHKPYRQSDLALRLQLLLGEEPSG